MVDLFNLPVCAAPSTGLPWHEAAGALKRRGAPLPDTTDPRSSLLGKQELRYRFSVVSSRVLVHHFLLDPNRPSPVIDVCREAGVISAEMVHEVGQAIRKRIELKSLAFCSVMSSPWACGLVFLSSDAKGRSGARATRGVSVLELSKLEARDVVPHFETWDRICKL